ncbi:DUF3551 domain-containing protein [Rhodoplanes serenus]|uniref:DUF3551 domain-containing protein n=1 Tax=Rhodoplanes serenus TaxID=200615 RepID=A0A327K5I5_9BRAD|nr:DUF3551 domain-containing protein [Rhodoplanes serenus]MTW19032.1 DUF3551 domain-containing protein [Rhodoplanes serenus]RAI32975.1 hypothetical protein CH340_13735 [Rhodoplanes serenus]
MRTWSIGLGLALVLVAGAADLRASRALAYPVYPWCAQYGGAFGGGVNCYFSQLWQCRQAVMGTGGYCYENPFAWGRPETEPPPRARKGRRVVR